MEIKKVIFENSTLIKFAISIINIFTKKAAYFPSKISTMEIIYKKGMTIINSNLKSDTFNCIINTDNTFEPAQVKEAINNFNERKLPFAWWTLAETPLELVLLEGGLTNDEVDIGMVADLKNIIIIQNKIDNFRIESVTSNEQLKDFVTVIDSMFEPKDPAINLFYEKVGALDYSCDKAPLKLYVGYYDNKPVTTGSIYIEETNCGIYDLATVKEMRKRGFATLILEYMLLIAKDNGVTTAMLQASEDGKSLYSKIGFKAVCKFKTFSNKLLLMENQEKIEKIFSI